MSSTARIERQTKESKVLVELDLDGSGRTDVSTGVGFYDHMLTAFGRHALFDLTVQTDGDTHIDAHHTVEDTAIVLGRRAAARRSATSPASAASVTHSCRWTRRWCSAPSTSPAAPTACTSASPRARSSSPSAGTGAGYLGSLTRHVFETLAHHAQIALHVRVLSGRDPHHIVESQFKAVARALRDAVALDPRETGVPSTKGTL